MKVIELAVLLIITAILTVGLIKGVDVFGQFTEGAYETLKTGVSILPALIALMTCVGMISASGAADALAELLAPVTEFLGFPAECVPLAVMRPISGSGATAVYEEILSENSPDSFIGRVASVLIGSTETTFYTIAVYFGAAKIKKTRNTLVSSLTADFTGFVFSVLAVRLVFGQ